MSSETLLAYLAAIGVLIGLGKLLGEAPQPTWRVALGRALTSGGLAVVGGIVMLWFPAASTIAVLGAGAALASLGTSALERLAVKYLKK